MPNPSYATLLSRPEWKLKRQEILERDNYTCQKCQRQSKNLHVHHLSYNGLPWEVDNSELITYCSGCHKYQHTQHFPFCAICKSKKADHICADVHTGEWRFECLECESSYGYWFEVEDLLNDYQTWVEHLSNKTWFRPALLRILMYKLWYPELEEMG
jgi:hypothetical protein